jgi:hypothetical protein
MQFDKSLTELQPSDGFKYKVEPCGGEMAGFQASIPFRQVFWMGNTPEEATSRMLRGIAKLARDGSLDPDDPERMGCPPIQHVLGLLTRSLVWQLDRRREKIDFANRNSVPLSTTIEDSKMSPTDIHQPPMLDPQFHRDNEILSGLATAIAALARVKEL